MPTTVMAFITACFNSLFYIMHLHLQVKVVEGTDIGENNYFLDGSFYLQWIVEYLA